MRIRVGWTAVALLGIGLTATAGPFAHPAGRFEITAPKGWTVTERLLADRVGLEFRFAPGGKSAERRGVAVTSFVFPPESPLRALSTEQLARRLLSELFMSEPALQAMPVGESDFVKETIDDCSAVRFRVSDGAAERASVWFVRRGETIVRLLEWAPDAATGACVRSLIVDRASAPRPGSRAALVYVTAVGTQRPDEGAAGAVVTTTGLVLAADSGSDGSEFRVKWDPALQRDPARARLVARSEAGFVLLRLEGDAPAEVLALSRAATLKGGAMVRALSFAPSGGPSRAEPTPVVAVQRDRFGDPRLVLVAGGPQWRRGSIAVDPGTGAAIAFALPGEQGALLPVEALLEEFPELRHARGSAGDAVTVDLLQRGRFFDATQRTERVLKTDPKARVGTLLRVELAGWLKDRKGVRAGIAGLPDDAMLRFLRARALRRAGLPDEALALLERIAPQHRELPRYALERARCHLAAKHFDEAIRDADRARSLDRARGPEADLVAAQAELDRKRPAKALRRYLQATETLEGCIEGWLGRARVAESSADWPSADKLYRGMAERFPASFEGPAGRGRSLIERKQGKEAYAILGEALRRANALRQVAPSRVYHDRVRAAELARGLDPEMDAACLEYVLAHPDDALAHVIWAERLLARARGLAYAHALLALRAGGTEEIVERASRIPEAELTGEDVRFLLEKNYAALGLRISQVAPLAASVVSGQLPDASYAWAVRATLSDRLARGTTGASKPVEKKRTGVREPRAVVTKDGSMRVLVPRSYAAADDARDALRSAGGVFVEHCFADSAHGAELILFVFDADIQDPPAAFKRISDVLGKGRKLTLNAEERKATETALALSGSGASKGGKALYWRVELHATTNGVRGALWTIPRSKRTAASADRIQIFRSLRVK